MASNAEDDLQCPTCSNVFKDPVILSCSHSFCRACVQQCWQQKGDRTCPVCGTECSWKDPPSNLALRNLSETLSKASVVSEDICSLHSEKLKLFCLDHQELVCLICRDSEIHAGHKFRPLDEVVKSHNGQLREGLQDAKIRLKDYNVAIDNCNEQAKHIVVQWEQVECKIKKDFKELRRLLRVEEEARLSAAIEDKQKKIQGMKEKIGALSSEMAALSDAIQSTEELLKSAPVPFMKDFKTAMTRIQKLPDKPELLKEALLDEAKHVGNLKFNVWERMKDVVSYSPVILDPNTADPELSLSEDLTSVSFGKMQQRPKNVERSMFGKVLGSAFASGTLAWEVEVGDNSNWKVGVAFGDPSLPDDMKLFTIAFRDDKYQKFGERLGSWEPPVKLQRVRVHVDMKELSVSFSESLTKTELCTKKPFSFRHLRHRLHALSAWRHLGHPERCMPCLWTADKIPLQIIPLEPRVTTHSQ